jgi:hypothetical protein
MGGKPRTRGSAAPRKERSAFRKGAPDSTRPGAPGLSHLGPGILGSNDCNQPNTDGAPMIDEQLTDSRQYGRNNWTNLWFDSDALPKDAVRSDPAIDPTAIIANLETLPVDGLHEMKILCTSHFAEHDVTHDESGTIHWYNRAKVAGLDSPLHRRASGPEGNGLPGTELFDVMSCPTHVLNALTLWGSFCASGWNRNSAIYPTPRYSRPSGHSPVTL